MGIAHNYDKLNNVCYTLILLVACLFLCLYASTSMLCHYHQLMCSDCKPVGAGNISETNHTILFGY